MLDFATTLIELGFVSHVDGVAVDAPGRQRDDDWERGDGVFVGLARPLFSPVAWAVYGALFLGCATVLVAAPELRPDRSDLFFAGTPLESAAVVTLLSIAAAVVHEGWHRLAARVEGVPARVRMSRRLYIFVLETDLSALWALPRRRRFGPLLAGLAFDTVLLSALLAGRIAVEADVWDPPSTVVRLLAALVLAVTIRIAFQFLVFLRTDIYAVLVVWLGCLNLTRVTELALKRPLVGLTDTEAAELGDASARDLQVARWYRWVYVAGLALAAWFLIALFAPWLVTLAAWTVASLADGADSLAFWEALVLGCLAFAPVLLAVSVMVRERRERRGS